MVHIKSVSGEEIKDSRGDGTMKVFVKTNVGEFFASAPQGKSTGKFEVVSYKKTIEEDIRKLEKCSDYFSFEDLKNFDDLQKVEDTISDQVGGNTLFALESAVLKAIAKEQRKEIWELINSKAKKFPKLLGNCIGGGEHSDNGNLRKPDFQEFHIISPSNKILKEGYEILKKTKKSVELDLKKSDEKFKSEKNDEAAWMTSLNDKQVLEVLKEKNLNLGLDVASSGFYSRKKYHYLNPKLDRTTDEQFDYLSNLIKNFEIFYIEDPFNEEDFESFAKLLKKFPDSLIVGDDLTVTNSERLEKAIKMKSINGIIVKPNQCGSLMEVKRVCEIAKKNDIKIIFSHRSGETEETILADLAFGFGADFFKCGIEGDIREKKILRLIEIEKGMK
jgi:enolase